MTLISRIRRRMEFIHSLLIAPPEKSNLNHFQRTSLEEEYEELEAKAAEDEKDSAEEVEAERNPRILECSL